VSFETIWAGWRNDYVVSATESERTGEDDACVFCRIAASGDPSPDNGVVWRGRATLVVLNLYPYASGHLLAMPLRHLGDLEELDAAEAAELWDAVRASSVALRAAYAPDGINIGANLGRAAGPGSPPISICTPCPMVGRHQLHDLGGRGPGDPRVAPGGVAEAPRRLARRLRARLRPSRRSGRGASAPGRARR